MTETIIKCDCCGEDCTRTNQSFFGGFWPNLVPTLCGTCRKAAKDALLERAKEGTAVWNAERHLAKR